METRITRAFAPASVTSLKPRIASVYLSTGLLATATAANDRAAFDARPTTRTTKMPTYMQELQAEAAAAQAESQRKKESIDAARAASWRDTMRPLRARLADLLTTIPDDVKSTGLSLSSLQVQLRGRTASKAHCGEVATALRQLGYRRVRVWKQTDTDGFNAVWREAK